MNGGECGYSCGFCHKGFRNLNRKLRHLRACKEICPVGKPTLSAGSGPRPGHAAQ